MLALGAVLATFFYASPAPANVEEQRARLPPPASCSDPVEGDWLSHTFNPRFNDWYMFTLRVRRIAPGSNELVGEIDSHYWNGSAADSEPPSCRPGLDNWITLMTATGRVDGQQIRFDGTAWRPGQTFCGSRGGYNLDHFAGRIDPALQEFQTVNNDGERMVDETTVFRRVACREPEPTPHVSVAPPPFYPQGSRGGCNCNW